MALLRRFWERIYFRRAYISRIPNQTNSASDDLLRSSLTECSKAEEQYIEDVEELSTGLQEIRRLVFELLDFQPVVPIQRSVEYIIANTGYVAKDHVFLRRQVQQMAEEGLICKFAKGVCFEMISRK